MAPLSALSHHGRTQAKLSRGMHLTNLPIPLANILPFSNASLNTAMLMPSSSMTSSAGRPEKSLEKRWSELIRSWAIRRRSDLYVLRIKRSATPLTTFATFQPRSYAKHQTHQPQDRSIAFRWVLFIHTILHTNIYTLARLRRMRMHCVSGQKDSLTQRKLSPTVCPI